MALAMSDKDSGASCTRGSRQHGVRKKSFCGVLSRFEGYLNKRSHGIFFSQWDRRYFVVDKTKGSLQWWRKKSHCEDGNKPVCEITLHPAMDITLDIPVNQFERENVFRIEDPEKKNSRGRTEFYLSAESEFVKYRWVTLLWDTIDPLGSKSANLGLTVGYCKKNEKKETGWDNTYEPVMLPWVVYLPVLWGELETITQTQNEWQRALRSKGIGKAHRMNITSVLRLLCPDVKNCVVREHAMAEILKFADEDLTAFMLQLVQAIRFDITRTDKELVTPLARILIKRATESLVIANKLRWLLQVEVDAPRPDGIIDLNELVEHFESLGFDISGEHSPTLFNGLCGGTDTDPAKVWRAQKERFTASLANFWEHLESEKAPAETQRIGAMLRRQGGFIRDLESVWNKSMEKKKEKISAKKLRLRRILSEGVKDVGYDKELTCHNTAMPCLKGAALAHPLKPDFLFQRIIPEKCSLFRSAQSPMLVTCTNGAIPGRIKPLMTSYSEAAIPSKAAKLLMSPAQRAAAVRRVQSMAPPTLPQRPTNSTMDRHAEDLAKSRAVRFADSPIAHPAPVAAHEAPPASPPAPPKTNFKPPEPERLVIQSSPLAPERREVTLAVLKARGLSEVLATVAGMAHGTGSGCAKGIKLYVGVKCCRKTFTTKSVEPKGDADLVTWNETMEMVYTSKRVIPKCITVTLSANLTKAKTKAAARRASMNARSRAGSASSPTAGCVDNVVELARIVVPLRDYWNKPVRQFWLLIDPSTGLSPSVACTTPRNKIPSPAFAEDDQPGLLIELEAVIEKFMRRSTRHVLAGNSDSADADVESSPLYQFIFKTGDDVRQDVLIMQLVELMDSWLLASLKKSYLSPYRILATGPLTGMVEMVANSTTLAELLDDHGSILQFFRDTGSGVPINEGCEADLGVDVKVLINFVHSCAGYSVITYLLGLGDRHFDNLMLKPSGHFFHIDFGWAFGHDPKPYPDKMRLNQDIIDGMGGVKSPWYRMFVDQCCQNFEILRRHRDEVNTILNLMVSAGITHMGVGKAATEAIQTVRDNFMPHLDDDKAKSELKSIISTCVGSVVPEVMEYFHGIAKSMK